MEQQTRTMAHAMRGIRVEKLTLNIGAGKDSKLLEKGVNLLQQITGLPPVKTVTQKRIPAWGLRPGLPIGCKITLRGKDAELLIPRLLVAKENKLSERNYDGAGSVSFGIPECIDIEGAKYDPAIGIIGLQACITLTRPGFRVKSRRIRSARIGKHHTIAKQEAITFMNEKFKTALEEDR